MRQLVIGIAGGTGSGKTSVTNKILERLKATDDVVVIQHDSYYRDISTFQGKKPEQINFDHPDALETSLLVQHIKELRSGTPVEQPQYDFATYTRLHGTRHLASKDIIIVEGILIFTSVESRNLFDIKIFIDTDADERLLRRLRRDIIKRGRTIDSVMDQYVTTVKPMHLEFVEPSKRYADIIIPRGSENLVGIEMVVVRIEALLNSLK